jgi:CBS domain-containing protein
MKLQELCVLDVACCVKSTSIAAAAKLMRQHHTGDLIVIDSVGDNSPIGILTDRDIVIEVLAQGRDPAQTVVGDVMSGNLVIASEAEDITVAIERMRQHGVRRLPVVDARDALKGIVTLDDLFKVHVEQASALLAVIAKEQSHETRSRR